MLGFLDFFIMFVICFVRLFRLSVCTSFVRLFVSLGSYSLGVC